MPLPYRFAGVSTGVRPSSLLLGQGGYELAAEVGDVGNDAAPDRVGSGLATSAYILRRVSQEAEDIRPAPAGVLTGVVQTPEEAEARVGQNVQ
jgi:hypothetical protein